MRRPSPLPAPPGAPAEGAPPATAVEPPPAAYEPRDAGPLEGADADEFVLGESAPREASRTVPEAAADAPASPGIRAGDVWRAARARRRALRAEVRRFTLRARRRRALWIGGIAAAFLLVAGTVGAAYSPLFAVERIRVIGAETVDAASVEAALAGQLGRPLPLVDASEVKAGLVGFPLIESYTLEARPPHELAVRIVERTPIGVVSSPAGFTVVDAAGVALSTSPVAPVGYPVIDAAGGVSSEAFAAAGQVLRTLPRDLRARVASVEASSPNDVAFVFGDTGTQIVWGSAEESAYKAVVLEALMTARPPEGVRSYDVSSPDAVVVR